VALGLVVLLFLSSYPDEPFDYSKPDGGRTKREGAMVGCGKLDTPTNDDPQRATRRRGHSSWATAVIRTQATPISKARKCLRMVCMLMGDPCAALVELPVKRSSPSVAQLPLVWNA